ncbi:MAG: hypothetical protein K2K16_10495 [Ruminococcus sp.]|nr:hypothetical protein [Ruminococcus sp.]
MKAKKFKIIGIFIIIVCLIYYNTHYAKIGSRTFKTDVKEINFVDLDNNRNIRQLNKCREVENLFITANKENSFSKLRNFHNLTLLMIANCNISSKDCEKISQFDKLENLYFNWCDIDFTGFNSDTISYIQLYSSDIKNFKPLAECKSLKDICIVDSTISDCIIKENDKKYVMKDSSIFADFDYLEELWLSYVNSIEDISGILEMDSLKTLKVKKEAISEDNVKLLEDKGVTVTYY